MVIIAEEVTYKGDEKMEAKNPYDDHAVMSAFAHEKADGSGRTSHLPSQEESEYDWKVQKMMFFATLAGMAILSVLT